jgi:pimeloyl-ACP methyl ester carboxylesterase
MSDEELFVGYEVSTGVIPAFFIESTAPVDIDDRNGKVLPTPDGCVRLPSVEDAVEKIATKLSEQKEPKLVITVHGFNNPRDSVLKYYTNSFLAVDGDEAIRDRGVVCMGYRWPSEHMGAPWRSGLSAAPLFLVGILLAALVVFWYVNFWLELCSIPSFLRIVITAVTSFMAIVPITLFLLRVIVYFRDGYRATTYGVPDLVDILRLIDGRLETKFKVAGRTGWRADLSIIGHSMGGFVVTNAVRILTDVFSPAAQPKARATGVIAPEDDPLREQRSEIGKAFRLKRLVLVSPDIPAEALMTGRANALQSSLARFEEAHLFSNEADEVLANISTTANFFSLPTRRHQYGFRLGNVGVLTPWGITKGLTLDRLRLGSRTLEQLYVGLQPLGFFAADNSQRLTYFDCTDSVDDQGHGVVSNAGTGRAQSLTSIAHLILLWDYIMNRKPDVHSGYFEPGFVGRLIYRFACIGYGDSEEAYGQFQAFSDACQKHQVKALRN